MSVLLARISTLAFTMAPLVPLVMMLTTTGAHAAPCCGGSSVAPTMLTGDDRAQLSATVSQGEIIGDAFLSGPAEFRANGDLERIQTLRLDGAYLLNDRWQAGISLPLIRRTRSTTLENAESTGVGDLGVNSAYEVLPEWEYSAWRPRGFVFAQALVPFGGSIYQSSYVNSTLWGLDARGRGFFSLSAGALFLKSWGNWDASFLGEGHRSFDRTFNSYYGPQTQMPGWGGTAALAGGYNFGNFRVGLSLSPIYEQGILTQSRNVNEYSDEKLVWNSSAQFGWMVTRDSTLSAIYTDQTLVGPAINVSLSRTIALTFQKRWER